MSNHPDSPSPHSTGEGSAAALARLQQLEARYRRQGDKRSVFAGAYVVITAAMHETLHRGRFHDSAWVEAYLNSFADLYLQAAHAYETDLRRGTAQVPAAWDVAFSTCRLPMVSPLTHLLLGINAHVNRDLALALVHAGIHEHRAARYQDHLHVNDVLKSAVDDLQSSVATGAPALAQLDAALGRWDERLACRVVAWGRDAAWTDAVRLASAQGALYEQHLLRLDSRAHRFAVLIRRAGRATTTPPHLDPRFD